MNEKLFKLINQYSGRFSLLDFLMIFVSNKTRYVFVFMLIFMWFKNGPLRKAVYNAGLSAGITLFLHTLIKLFYFKPRPFVKRRVGILIPSKRDSTFPSKHTLLVFATLNRSSKNTLKNTHHKDGYSLINAFLIGFFRAFIWG